VKIENFGGLKIKGKEIKATKTKCWYSHREQKHI